MPPARRRVSAYIVVLVALGIIGAAYAALAPSGRAESNAPDADLIAKGNALFLQGCSTCHGLSGQGSKVAPSLIGVGAAAVDFQVGTGRMPLALRGPEANKKPLRYSQADIDALAAYVESLGGGPKVPTDRPVTSTPRPCGPRRGWRAVPHQLRVVPQLRRQGRRAGARSLRTELTNTTPKHIYEAMETGPSNMPVFGDKTLTPEQKRDIITYLVDFRNQADPGGHSLGRIGPVSEGLVGWLVGIGLLVLAAVWIGARA